jgi:hypothetical protein
MGKECSMVTVPWPPHGIYRYHTRGMPAHYYGHSKQSCINIGLNNQNIFVNFNTNI